MHNVTIILATAVLVAFLLPAVAVEANSTRASASVRIADRSEVGGLTKHSDLVLSTGPSVQLASAGSDRRQYIPTDLLEAEPARFSLPGSDDKHFVLSLPTDGVVYLDCISHDCLGRRMEARAFDQIRVDADDQTGATRRFMDVRGELDLPSPGVTGSYQGTFEMIVHYE